MAVEIPEYVNFQSCADVVEFFRDARPYFNPEILEKNMRNSLYWNRFDTKTWPQNTATEQTAFRLPRGGYDATTPWRQVGAECGDDTCGGNLQVIQMPGSEAYNFQLLEKDFTTPQFCIDKWLFKLFPTAQISHMLTNLGRVSIDVNQEFARANVIGLAAYHWLPLATDNGAYCGEFEQEGWYVEQFDGAGEGGYNLQYIRVNIDPANLGNIALLGLDILDDVLMKLSRQDDAYRLDVAAATGGIKLLDLIVPDAKTARNLQIQAKFNAGNWYSEAGYTNDLKQLQLGVAHTVGNYMITYDSEAPRFNADSAFNATLTYNPANPATWPRLIRVPSQILVAADGEGCKYDLNPAYDEADFGITMPWVPEPVTIWTSPNPAIAGIAPGQPGFSMDWEMIRPPFSECNRFDNQVLWQARIRRAAQVDDPQLLHPILHRIDKRRRADGACCEINTTYVPPVDPNCYVCSVEEED